MPSNSTAEPAVGAGHLGGAEPQPYDFRRPTKLAREHGRLLEMVYETVARQWGTVLGSEIGAQCQVVFESVEQRSYDDYVSSMPSPNLMAVFVPEPHTGAGFLQMSTQTGFEAIERMLGGRGGEQPVRIPTEIETQLIMRVAERLLGELRYGLAAVTEIAPALKSLEFNPQFVQVAAATDLYIVASFTIKIGDSSAPASVALPAPVLVVRASDSATADDAAARAARQQARGSMVQAIGDVPVDVVVRFVPRSMPTSRLLELREGDVIRLDHAVDRPLDVVSAGVVCARGVAGAQGARAACLVTDAVLSGMASVVAAASSTSSGTVTAPGSVLPGRASS
jgi:flagellar motor switch protein FliM